MKSRFPLLVLSLASLGACAHFTPPVPEGMRSVPTAADLHEIQVTEGAERLEVPVTPGYPSISASDRAQLQRFAGGYLRYGHGALVLSTPSGGSNSEAASMLASETRRALVDAGISYAAVAGSSYDASGRADAPIIVSFARYEAQAPECAPLWEQDLAHQWDNQPWESFGCATQANLAALVEDPADLLRPRDEDPRDSGRRDTVLDHYRNGEPTHAERSTDERIAISNAVQ